MTSNGQFFHIVNWTGLWTVKNESSKVCILIHVIRLHVFGNNTSITVDLKYSHLSEVQCDAQIP